MDWGTVILLTIWLGALLLLWQRTETRRRRIVMLLLLTYIPEISLTLPNLIMGKE